MLEETIKSGAIIRIPKLHMEPFVICADYEVANIILNEPSHDKPDTYKVLDIGTGCPNILTKKTASKGSNGWAPERKAFSLFFTKSKYGFGVTEDRLAQLDLILSSIIAKKQGVFSAPELMVQLTIDAFGSSAFGVDMSAMSGPESSLGRCFLREIDFAHREFIKNQSARPWRRLMWWDTDVQRARLASDRLVELGLQIIEHARRSKSENPEDQLCGVMETLLSFPYPSDKDRAVAVKTFLTGGYDTTGYTLAWTLYELARNPAEQAALALELQQSEANQLPPRLGWVVNESMRLWPVVAGGGGRQLSKDIITPSKILIKKGTVVSLPFFSTYRQPWISEADRFIPDRWRDDAPQLAELRKMFNPFSRGRRNCIGQTHALITVKTVLAHLIRNYQWSVAKEPTPDFFLTLKPDGLCLRVESRPQ